MPNLLARTMVLLATSYTTHKTPYHQLQDFEALTPNLLARTMEMVEGGGIKICSRSCTLSSCLHIPMQDFEALSPNLLARTIHPSATPHTMHIIVSPNAGL